MTPEKCMSMMLKTMAKIAEADQAAPVHDCVLSVSDRAPRPPRRRRRRRRRRTTPRAPRRAAAAHCAAHLPSARRPQHTPLRSTWAALRLCAPPRPPTPLPTHWPQVPAYFTQAERHAMLDAAKIVGYAPRSTCCTSPNP